jgi:pimeloyl-ACP methyl ester carboxylesterase
MSTSFILRWCPFSLRWLVGLFTLFLAALNAWTLGGLDLTGMHRKPGLPPLLLSACHLESLAEEILCGVHEVYEDRDASSGRRIPIHLAILPPLRRSAAPDPLYILAGGPGQGARSYAAIAARYFTEVRRSRAIVLVDLRGTGASNPLDCARPADEMAGLDSSADLYLAEAKACLAQIEADPRRYTHAMALDDLDEIRRRLGHDRINLWGGSWGTRAALLYALRYPQAVRSVVLDGAVSLQEEFPGAAARNAERALDLLFDRCAADRACASAFPNPRGELHTVLMRLVRAPLTATIRHPRTARPVSVTLTQDVVLEIVRVALYTPRDAARLLQLIRHAARGDYAPLAAQYVHSASMTTDDMALGFTMSILCSEDVMPQADLGPRPAVFGDGYAGAWQSRCRVWPKGPPLRVNREATSEAPALILSGAHDPVTPPASGEAMGRHFPSHLHVVVPGAAHNASFTGCVPDLIAGFLEAGIDRLDPGCAAAAPLPPIVVNAAGGRP